MSTNAIVRIKEKVGGRVVTTELYKHCDGYIEGVGYTLLEMFMKFDNTIKINENTERIVYELQRLDFEYTIRKWLGVEYIYTIDVDNDTLEMASCHTHNNKYIKDYIYDVNDIIKEHEKYRRNLVL